MAAGAIIGGIIGGVVGAFGTAHGIREQQEAMREAYIKQMENLMLNYNYNQNALDQEQRFNLDQTKKNLFNITFQGIQNNAGVEAALAETGTEGRTSQQISRAITGQVSRQKTSVIENYEQQEYQIKRQRDNLYIQTKRTVDQAEENFENMQSSTFENVMQVFQGSLQGSIQGAMIGSGIGGGFGAMMGGASAAGAGASAAGGAASAASAGSAATAASGAASAASGASSGWSFSNFLGGFNKGYSQFENMFQSVNGLSNMFGMFGGNSNRQYNRYNFF